MAQSLQGKTSPSWLTTHQASIREPVASEQDYDAIVAAMNRALERLSREIAGAISERNV